MYELIWLMTSKYFFDISFHYFRSYQEICHAAETFGSQPLNRKDRVSKLSDHRHWHENRTFHMNWTEPQCTFLRAHLRCTQIRFSYDLQN